jgi:hypothetical protein
MPRHSPPPAPPLFRDRPPLRRFVVMSGLPGSGKTTVGRQLAHALGLPLLDKDEILEALFDSLGVGDAEWRNRLSRSAEVLRRLARPPQVASESGTPTGWLRSLPGSVVEAHCACFPAIAAERFLARKRHDGHRDRDKRKEDLAVAFEQLAAQGPLGLGPLVNIDTGQEVDLELVSRELEDHFRMPR